MKIVPSVEEIDAVTQVVEKLCYARMDTSLTAEWL